MRSILFIVPMVVALAAGPIWAGSVKSTSSCSTTGAEKDCSFDISIEGKITATTFVDVKKALADRDQMMRREGDQNDWWSIHIDSPGGSVNAAIEIGRLLRSKDAPIAVGDDQVCVSACVLILAGATHRFIYGRVGIHRPYFETPKSDVSVEEVQKAYSSMTEEFRSYLREMNVSDRLADDMMVVSPEEVRFLSSKELISYGLGFVDPVAKEAVDLQEARTLGIDRSEYMRRRALSEGLCKGADSSATGAYVLSQACVTAVLSGKHVERAPTCQNMAATCQPWEREWNGKKPDPGDVVTGDGFLVSGGN